MCLQDQKRPNEWGLLLGITYTLSSIAAKILKSAKIHSR